MIKLTAQLWMWSGESATWYFLTIPDDLSSEIRAESLLRRGGFGSVRVEVTVDDVTWRTSVFPQKNGGYVLPVKADVRRRPNIAAGDEVTAKLELL
jgi:hypothetical protein